MVALYVSHTPTGISTTRPANANRHLYRTPLKRRSRSIATLRPANTNKTPLPPISQTRRRTETSHSPSLLHVRPRRGESCALLMFTKLYVQPNHSVSLPLACAVTSRLPSACHCKRRSALEAEQGEEKEGHGRGRWGRGKRRERGREEHWKRRNVKRREKKVAGERENESKDTEGKGQQLKERLTLTFLSSALSFSPRTNSSFCFLILLPPSTPPPVVR